MAIDPLVVAAWVRDSCASQGVAVKVTDPVVVHRVGVLLTAGTGGMRAHGATAPSTHPPAPAHSRHTG